MSCIAMLSKKFVLFCMIWCRAVRKGFCTVKLVFFIEICFVRMMFCNFFLDCYGSFVHMNNGVV
jgi:hypothetical protein